MDCVLHIGLEKTGTTSIQHCLAKNRNQLKSQGILYPACLGEFGHVKLAAYAADEEKICDIRTGLGIKSPKEVLRFRQNVCLQLEREMTQGKYTTLLLSNENLSSRLHGKSEIRRLEQLVRFFCNKVTVYVYLRRQSDMYNSAVSTAISSNCSMDANVMTLPDFNSDAFQFRYNYWDLLQRWEAVFGRENIVVRLYEKEMLYNDNVVDDFFHTVQLDFVCETRTYSNKSMHKEKLLFLYNLNKFFPRIGDKKNNPFYKHVLDAVECIQEDTPVFEVSMSETIDAYFEDSNKEIARAYFDAEELFVNKHKTAESSDALSTIDMEKSFELFSEVLHHVLVDCLIENNILKYALNKHCLPQVIRKIEDCCVFYRDSDKLFAHLGHLYLQNKDLAKARGAYLEALRIVPENAAYHLQISVIDVQQKNIASAIAYAQAAVGLEKDNPYAHFHLGTLRMLTRDFQSALESLAIALKIGPGNKAFINAYKKAQEYTAAVGC